MKHGENASPVALPNQNSGLSAGDHFLPTVQTHVIAECPPSPTPPPAVPQPSLVPPSGGRAPSATSSSSTSSRRSAAPAPAPAPARPAPARPAPEANSGSEKGSLQVSGAPCCFFRSPFLPSGVGVSVCFPSFFVVLVSVCHVILFLFVSLAHNLLFGLLALSLLVS